MSQAELPHMPPVPAPLPKISERELQAGIVQTARILGYRVTAFRPAWTGKGYRTPLQGDKGWPDLVLCGRGRFLVRELKVAANTLSDEQVAWIRELEAAGIDVGVWTEADWFGGLVEAELRRGPESEAA